MKRTILIFAAIFFASCAARHNSAKELLEKADFLMEQHPDSSMAILDSLDRTLLNTRKLRARHALLYSIALDKNYIDVADDSLTSVAVSWYSKHGTVRNKMLAYYYHGRVCRNAGEYISSIIAYANAEKYALQAEEWLYLGLIYRGIAEIYNDNYNHAVQLKYAALAKDCFEKTSSQIHYNYSLLDIATANYNLKDFDTAKERCLEIIAMSENNKDTAILKGALELYASAILFQSEPEPETAIKIKTYLIDSLKYEPSVRDWNEMAFAYSLAGQYVMASDIISQLKPLVRKSDISNASVAMTEYKIEKAQGKYRQALDKFEIAVNIQDSIFYSILSQSVLSARKDYFKQQSEYDAYRFKVWSRTVIAIMTIAVFIILSIGIFLYRKFKAKENEKDREIERYMSQVNDMVEQMVHKDMETKQAISEFEIQIGNLYRLKFNFFDEICKHYYSYANTKAKQRQIFTTVEASISELAGDMEFKSLESIVNSFKGGVMSKLRQEFSQFKEDDFKIMCYWYAGFSSASMSLLLKEENMNVIYKRKSRLKDKIEKSDSPLKTFFIDKLRK